MKERSHETKQDGSNLKQATTMTSTNINKQQRYRSHQKKKKDRETVCVCVVLCDNGGYTNMKKEKKKKRIMPAHVHKKRESEINGNISKKKLFMCCKVTSMVPAFFFSPRCLYVYLYS